jgi:hypothetical protein
MTCVFILRRLKKSVELEMSSIENKKARKPMTAEAKAAMAVKRRATLAAKGIATMTPVPIIDMKADLSVLFKQMNMLCEEGRKESSGRGETDPKLRTKRINRIGKLQDEIGIAIQLAVKEQDSPSARAVRAHLAK